MISPVSHGPAEALERRVLMSVGVAAPAVIGPDVSFGSASGRGGSAVLTEGGGTRVTLSLFGPGPAHAVATDAGLTVPLSDTTERTVFSIEPVEPAGRVRLAALDVQGSLGRLAAPRADLAGDVTVGGSLRQAFLGDVPGAAPTTLRVGAGQRNALSLGRVRDLSIDAPSAGFAAIEATAWDDDPANGLARVTAASPWPGSPSTATPGSSCAPTGWAPSR